MTELVRTGDTVKRVDYQCSKCGSKDTVKLFPGELTPQAFNCWDCKAGRGLELSGMLMDGIGMFQIQVDEVTH